MNFDLNEEQKGIQKAMPARRNELRRAGTGFETVDECEDRGITFF